MKYQVYKDGFLVALLSHDKDSIISDIYTTISEYENDLKEEWKTTPKIEKIFFIACETTEFVEEIIGEINKKGLLRENIKNTYSSFSSNFKCNIEKKWFGCKLDEEKSISFNNHKDICKKNHPIEIIITWKLIS